MDYQPLSGVFDEMMEPSGRIRPGWAEFLSTLDSLGPGELNSRWDLVRHLLRENGVTFNVHGSADGMERLWELDPFPLILQAREWERIEKGLKQRARLLELLLDDVYGAQICLKQGWLPPALVHAHPAFLRPCHGIGVVDKARLLLHSVDLARGDDGEMMVLRSRAETPAGCGYALENRLALVRMIPEFFESKRVRKLAGFFRSLRETLGELAEQTTSTPRIVLLSPGFRSQTYFEQAYIAQYLGISLVRSDDLTVRDDRVYLKLLEGLQPVGVILKRLSDSLCDPLELRSDSVIGVPGLVQAVRAGNVVVANCLGSGWLETPALQAFLPSLCRHFLDQDLILPGVPTWWCGDAPSLAYVLEHLDDLVLKWTFSNQARTSLFPEGTTREQREVIRRRLQDQPHNFVAQKRLTLSTTPFHSGQKLEPRRVVLRTFLTRDGRDFQVLPGALSLVSKQSGSVLASLEQGAGSKDTWIVAEEDPEFGQAEIPLRGRSRTPIELSRGGSDIPSRSADDLYWLGRTLERGENLCRMLRCGVARLNMEPRGLENSEVPLLMHLINPRWHPKHADRSTYEARLISLLNRPGQADGLRPVMESFDRMVSSVRDRISTESWRLSNHLYELSHGQPETLRDLQTLLDDLLMAFSAFHGMVSENMTRGHGWRFLELGRRLERALQMVSILRRALGQKRQPEEQILEALLEVADGVRTYRRRYPAGLQVAPVLDLLLADETNPRSVSYQLDLMTTHLQRLPGAAQEGALGPEHRVLLKCHSAVRLADVHELAEANGQGRRSHLTSLLKDLSRELPRLSDLLVHRYFTHLVAKRPDVSYGREVLP